MADIVLNRLQFVKHDEVFPNREEAINYVLNIQNFERPSLVAEPMILRYESGSAVKGPNVILAIGSVGDGITSSNNNRTFFIDTQKTEEEIEELRELIEQAIASLALKPIDSDTIDLSVEKTDEGTFLSGNVKIADYRIIDEKIVNNIIETEGNKGIYAFVDMEYDPDTAIITFKTTAQTKEFQLPPDQHLVKGWYDPREESIFFKLADDSQVKVPVTKLIDEWTVLPDSDTPVLLFKEHVSAITEGHEGIYDWQDVLTADVRVADHIDDNIIHKDRTGRFLYVKGTADNIKYKNGQTVADALDNIDTKVSTSAGNIIYKRPDGIYTYAMLDYKQAENKIVYKYTNGSTGELNTVEFQLNSVKLLEDITYDPVKEEIVIRYIDAQGEYQRVEIPVADIIEEWDVLNEGHNIQLNKFRSEGQGKDILTADAKIYQGYNNILEDKNHELYVNGIAENIKYDVTGDTTVKAVLDELKAEDEDLDNKIDDEIARAKAAEQALDNKIDQEIEDRIADVDEEQARAEAAEEVLTNKIGTGFTDDPHENVTAKYEELSGKTDDEIARATAKDAELEETINNEIARSTEKDAQLEAAIAAETARATAAEDALQDEIDAVSADSASSLKQIVNNDHSISVDDTEKTRPVISVNLSNEIEDSKLNIIKLNNDGLYAGVDLTYSAASNTLVFKTTNGSKEIQLESISSIISIEYVPSLEVIRITYLANGHEIKTTDVPVGDLINEWRVEDGHPHAVQLEKVRAASGSSEQDILKASVVISDAHEDNILSMDNGALYVPGYQIEQNKNSISQLRTDLSSEVERSIAADEELNSAIGVETNRAISAETALNGIIVNEATRATFEESRIETKLENEINRSTNKDEELSNNISNEASRAALREEELNTAITNETLRAQEADNELYQKIADEKSAREIHDATLDAKIETEKSRAQVAENTISGMLLTEISNRENADNNLSNSLADETEARQSGYEALLNAINAATLDFGETTSIKLVKDNNNNVTANVKLANSPDNIILIDNEEQGKEGLYASVDFDYEPATNKIIFDVNGVIKEFTIAAGSILDDAWYDPITKNLVFRTKTAEGQFVEVTVPAYDLFDEWEVNQPVTGTALSLTLTTGRTDPTSHEPLPNQLSGTVLISPIEDNALIMDTNGLYVSGSGSSKAECADKKVNKVYQLLYGEGAGMQDCGEGTEYVPGTGCIISAATSFNEADQLLNDAFCSFIDDWEIYGFDTPSTHTDWLKIGQNRHMLVDVRLSHGLNGYEEGGMTDDELLIKDFSGDFIEPGVSGFTDTNVLRITNIERGKSGEPLDPANKYNGVYLSNVWDCGLYYGLTESDIAAKAAAEAAGYNTDYSTDETDEGKAINYMNNVRQ